MAGLSCQLSFGEQKKSKRTVDRISSLPCDVLDIILGKLSIVEAVRTSVLSKDWRRNWLSLSKLKLEYISMSAALNTRNIRWDIYSSVINKFILHHRGSIKVFHLEASCACHHSDLCIWIEYLSKLDVEELFIGLYEYQRRFQIFQMPAHLFMFMRLQSLFLVCCAVRIPSTFRKFNTLLKLSLRKVEISDEDLYRLILACPNLVELKLLMISGLKHLSINSPKLTVLKIDTCMEDITIVNAAYLVSVYIKDASHISRKIPNRQSVIHCLSSLNVLQNLVLYGHFIQIFAADYDAFQTFPLRNDTLTCLTVRYARFDSTEAFRVFLSVLSSCPNIESLRLKIDATGYPKVLTTFFKENHGQFSFLQLKSISVACPCGSEVGCIVKIIEFICAHSPNLKNLSIQLAKMFEMQPTQVSRMLSRLRKSCPPNVSVQFKRL